jgi:hypothetical protein
MPTHLRAPSIFFYALQVGDAGPILDTLAVVLENISSTTPVAQSTISAAYRTAQIIASLPNLSYKSKVRLIEHILSFRPLLYRLFNKIFYKLQAFPEALFHQLIIAMVYPDCETHLGAHRIFSVVLVPSSVSPCSFSGTPQTSKSNLHRTLSRQSSVFSSSAAIFGKLKRDVFSFRESPRRDNSNLMSISEDSDQGSENEPKLFKSQTIQRMTSIRDTSCQSATEISNPSGHIQETVCIILSFLVANRIIQ